MPIGTFLKGIFAGKTGTLVEKVGGVIDNLTLSKEEKEKFKIDTLTAINSHEEKMAEAYAKQFELEIKDMADARDSNVKIQESGNASWLAKNVGYILDLLIGGIWSALTLVIIGKAFKLVGADVDWATVLSVYSTVTAVFMTCLNFHRSSSAGSKQKDDRLDKMMNK